MSPVSEQLPVEARNLATCLKEGDVHHAYLITGPGGAGKKALAHDIAKIVNCRSQSSPCNACEPCRRIGEGLHSDVCLIQLADSQGQESRSAIGTQEIEVIQHSAVLPPFEGKYKVFIIDGADLLSASAANRLLKILEEPPPGVLFILTSGSTEDVMPTVVSRCQILGLKPVAVEKIASTLIERHNVNPEHAWLVARLSEGRLGWAIKAATDDKILSDYTDRRNRILEVMDSSYEQRFAYAQSLAARFNYDRGRVAGELSLWLVIGRDILLVKFDLEKEIVNQDLGAKIAGIAGQLTAVVLTRFLKTVSQTQFYLQRNVNPRLALEAMMLSLDPGAGCLTNRG